MFTFVSWKRVLFFMTSFAIISLEILFPKLKRKYETGIVVISTVGIQQA